MGYGHSHGEELLEFSAKRPSKVKSLDPDAQIHIDGTDGGSFAIASNRKELKQLMFSPLGLLMYFPKILQIES